MVIKGSRKVFAGPGLGGMPEGLDPHDELAGRFVRNPSVSPSGCGGGEEAWAF